MQKNVRLCRTKTDLKANGFHKELKCGFGLVYSSLRKQDFLNFTDWQICETTDYLSFRIYMYYVVLHISWTYNKKPNHRTLEAFPKKWHVLDLDVYIAKPFSIRAM